jgi:tetraprenyl-beta-curcumene synthase
VLSVLQRTKDRSLIVPYIIRIFPAVERELDIWRAKAAAIPHPELRRQALASLEKKRFHCQGGSIYALFAPHKATELVRFVVALQTISDYLDNLCDRVSEANDDAFRTLHLAMTAAVDSQSATSAWYADYPYKDDGGYLDQLVQTSRKALTELMGYGDIHQELLHITRLYSDLQVYKHMNPRQRIEMLVRWHSRHAELSPDVYWWEFAAASGSTLGVFALAAMAANGPVTRTEIDTLMGCYFPWLCGLHILLDYFIDLDEDREHDDLNFVAFYPGVLAMEDGLTNFVRQTLAQVQHLPRPAFHRTVTMGLLALYLSDPKASQGGRSKISQQLLRYDGNEALWLQRICITLRNNGMI